MTDRGARVAVVLIASVLVAGPASGQSATDATVAGMATFASETFVGGAVGLGVRPSGRLRVAVLGALGTEAGALAGRAEAMAVFHLNPYRRAGWAAYGGAGAAVVFRPGEESGYLLALVGIESRPAGQTGWFVELGVGGGVRAAAGLRLRRVRPLR